MPIENSIERVTHAGYFSSHVWKTMETKKILQAKFVQSRHCGNTLTRIICQNNPISITTFQSLLSKNEWKI